MSSNRSIIPVMDQRVGNESKLKGRTPLSHLGNQSIDQATLLCQEQPMVGLLTLRTGSGTRDVLSSALQKALSIELPTRLQSLESTGGHCIRWMSPDEWLLSCSLEETVPLEQQLREAVRGHLAIVNVSGGFTTLLLSGPNATEIMSLSTSYNINPEHFPPGKVVNTVMAKAQVTLRAVSENAFEIIVRRSFADYLYLWLQRAGREYGLQFSTAG